MTDTIIGVAITLFLIMDPLGNVPIFLSTLKHVSPARRTKIIARELVIALVVMVTFLYFGPVILSALSLTPAAVGIAGGLVLMIIALKMIFPSPDGFVSAEHDEPLIVPLAIPLIAGPSVLASLVLLSSQNNTSDWLIALIAAWFGSAVILLSANALFRWIGKRGLAAMERLMGMILVSISVQMLLNGVTRALEK